MADTWNNFSSSVSSQINGIESDLLAQIQAFQSAFSNLTTDPLTFIEQSFSTILNIFLEIAKNLATLALKAIDACIEVFLSFVMDFINGVLALIQTPIHVPVLSDLWGTVFGGSMSFLDLCAWTIAVPVSLISQATSLSSSGQQTAYSASDSLSQRIWILATMFGAGIDGIADASNASADSTIAILDIAFAAAVWGNSFSASFATDGPELAVYFALGALPIILSLVGVVLKSSDDPEAALGYDKSAATLFSVYGSGMGILSTFFAEMFPEKFSDPNGLTFSSNLLSACSYAMKKGNDGGPTTKLLVGVSDFALPTTAMFLGVAAADQS